MICEQIHRRYFRIFCILRLFWKKYTAVSTGFEIFCPVQVGQRVFRMGQFLIISNPMSQSFFGEQKFATTIRLSYSSLNLR